MIRALRCGFIIFAILLGVAGFTLSALILAIGSVLLAPYDLEVSE